MTDELVEILAKIHEAGGNKAAAFTLRSVGAVGTVFEAQLAVLAAVTPRIEAQGAAKERTRILKVLNEMQAGDHRSQP